MYLEHILVLFANESDARVQVTQAWNTIQNTRRSQKRFAMRLIASLTLGNTKVARHVLTHFIPLGGGNFFNELFKEEILSQK